MIYQVRSSTVSHAAVLSIVTQRVMTLYKGCVGDVAWRHQKRLHRRLISTVGGWWRQRHHCPVGWGSHVLEKVHGRDERIVLSSFLIFASTLLHKPSQYISHWVEKSFHGKQTWETYLCVLGTCPIKEHFLLANKSVVHSNCPRLLHQTQVYPCLEC